MLRKKVSGESTPTVVSFDKCPAKTHTKNDGTVEQGRSVLNHCTIVGEVARALIGRIPPAVAMDLFPVGAPLVASLHDIGKVSPTFVEKIRQACTPGYSELDALSGINPQLENNWGGHAGVSQVTAKALNAPRHIPEILGQHHGFAPAVAGLRANDENFGGTLWQEQRVALVSALKKQLQLDWPIIETAAQARLLAGLTSVSDWIGSGQYFEDPSSPWQENIGPALDAAGFIPAAFQTGLSFEEVFSFHPHNAQTELIDQVVGPGIYILEAPMGLGKTEAALYAAYRVLEKGQATGIYFALPTQLTSNKIFDRFNDFLGAILAEDCKHRSLLLHSNAWLLDTDMGEDGRPGGAWFNSAKRGLLAPFAVGTIDQALMAAMNVKHGFVRAFGLAGKVVILDEGHTYDAYTGTLLDALVELLRGLKCTVIILSATLNQDRRQQLLGRRVQSKEYPLITACPSASDAREIPVPAGPNQCLSIAMHRKEEEAIEQALLRAEQGQQVLWIENTVQEAQRRYLDLAARALEIGITCGLLHSRFTQQGRQVKEDLWVNLFGRAGRVERADQGRILVGTQVLEQSLDIDADFMVSRFAPTDMLLQRLGRLWRHADTPRPQAARCEAWFIAPDLDQAINTPEQAFGGSAFIYSPYVLCRSLEVWQSVSAIQLPGDIRDLIERTYCLRDEDGAMSTWLAELENGSRRRKGRNAMRQLARVTLADVGNTLPENKAQTRYSEVENCEVLLLRRILFRPDKQLTVLTLLDGTQVQIPEHRHKLSRTQWRQISAKLMRQVVATRAQDAPLPLQIDLLQRFGLHHSFYLGNPAWDEALLRVALVDEAGRLYGVQHAPLHDKYLLEYRDDLGYRVIKN